MICGAGKICKMCGPGEHSAINLGFKLPDGDCKKIQVPRAGGATAMMRSWCNNRINQGSNCPALYDHFYGYCLDFCCNFVFSTCKCMCCECLEGAGGACNGEDCTSVSCPGSG